MRTTPHWYRSGTIAISLLFVLFSKYSAADPPTQPTAALTTLRDSAVNAAEMRSATKAFSELFEHASDETLATLKADTHIGISLYAAHRMRSSKNPNVVASSHPERFLGFLEGRTGLSCPPIWASRLVVDDNDFMPIALRTYGPSGLITIEDEDIGLKKGEGIPVWWNSGPNLHRVQLDGRSFQCPSALDVRGNHLVVGKKEIPLQAPFLGALRKAKFKDYLNAIIFEGKVFVIAWEGVPYKYPIFCLDAVSGEMLWESEVWGMFNSKPPHSYFGTFFHAVELTSNRGTVGVFGIAHQGQYSEGFDVNSGKSVYRFSPWPWYREAK